MVDQPGILDLSGRLREFSAEGDDLERIAALVDFAQFRPELERAVPRGDGAKGSRPAFDRVLMFKVLLLQAMHGLSMSGANTLSRTACRLSASWALDWPTQCRTRTRSGPSARRSSGPARWRRCLPALMPRCGRAAIWRWAVRSWLRRSWPRPSSEHAGRAGGDQGQRDPQRLGGEAREAAPEGPRCPLDGEVQQSHGA